MIKEKKGWVNSMLLDSDYIRGLDFKDTYYLETLFKHIHNFIIKIPIQVLVNYKEDIYKIYFNIGKDISIGKYINMDISYWDFITIIKRDLIEYFPQCELEEEIETSYTDDEIIEMRNESLEKKIDFDINDALEKKKIEKIKTKYLIEKINIKDDEFLLNVDDEKSVRISGTLDNPFPLSKFLSQIRIKKLKGKDLKDFIFNNSRELRKVTTEYDDIIINYPVNQMMNFFKINYPDQVGVPMVKVDNEYDTYRWGKFKVKFESKLLESDCKNFLLNKGEEVYGDFL